MVRNWKAGGAAALVLIATAVSDAATVAGRPAPPFRITTFAGDKFTDADLRGKVIVINHWATWCGPCKQELPAMDAYYRRHAARGLVIFAVTTEDSAPKAALKRVAEVMAIPLSNRFRGAGYGPIKGAVPTSYVIDRAGVVRHAKAGAFTAASFAATIDPLLAEPAPVS